MLYRKACLLLLLLFTAASTAEEVEFFRVAESGYNISMAKVGLPRVDYLPEGGRLEVVVRAHTLQNEEIEGELTLTLTPETPFRYIRGSDLLGDFDVQAGDFIHLDLTAHHKAGDGQVALPCEVDCPLAVSHLMVDQLDEIRNPRRMDLTGGALSFFNKGGNDLNHSYLLLRNIAAEPAIVYVDARTDFSERPELIAEISLAANESVILPSRALEDGSDPHVIKPFEPATGNRSLAIGSDRLGVRVASWIQNGPAFQPVSGAHFRDTLLFYPADPDPLNRPLLVFTYLHDYFVNSEVQDIHILAYDENGKRLEGEASIVPPSDAISAEQLFVWNHELRFGNPDKGITSSFGDDLQGIVRLSLEYRGSCGPYDYDCKPAVQLLLLDQSNGVRDLGVQNVFDHPNREFVHVETFFNPSEDSDQDFLLLYNPEPYPTEVLVSDVHQDPAASIAVVKLAPKSFRLLSSAALEAGSDEVEGGLLAAAENRQLKLVSLRGNVEYLNLVFDSDGYWRSITTPKWKPDSSLSGLDL